MESDLEVLEERPSLGPRAVAAALQLRPDVMVADYWMPEMNGPAVAAVVASRMQGSVLLLSWLFTPREIQNAFAAGAAAFISKSLGVSELALAIRRVAEGERGVLPGKFGKGVALRLEAPASEIWPRLASLTDREIEILRLLGLGFSKSRIAGALSVTPDTARTHIENIRRKLDARTQVEAVAIARQNGLIPP